MKEAGHAEDRMTWQNPRLIRTICLRYRINLDTVIISAGVNSTLIYYQPKL